jgi:nicotinate-nucleotide pyrophosphorylase (carboxylating)
MNKPDFHQTRWDAEVEHDFRILLDLAIQEDVRGSVDITTDAVVPKTARGKVVLSSREEGVLAGMAMVPIIMEYAPDVKWTPFMNDSDPLYPGCKIGALEGNARQILHIERPLLNFMSRLCGIASLTHFYVEWVDLIEGKKPGIYDTRKTTPGWRLLEKYAIQCGGGKNHRCGLYDAILIKDNHLAFGGITDFGPGEAVRRARKYLEEHYAGWELPMLEIEVDSLKQLEQVLPENPDVVLLDNMSPDMMREAVQMRREVGATCEFEASGGITLETVRAKAESGVERVSVGALTHSAKTFDIGLDWI